MCTIGSIPIALRVLPCSMSSSCVSHHSSTVYLLTRTPSRKHELFSLLLLAELEGIACKLQFFDLFSWWAKQHGYFFLNKLSLTVKQLLRKQKVLCEILTFRPAAQAYTMSCASFREFHMPLWRYIGLHPSLCFSHILKKGDHSSKVRSEMERLLWIQPFNMPHCSATPIFLRYYLMKGFA